MEAEADRKNAPLSGEERRISELEGYIKTIVAENPDLFCCGQCIPTAPELPRYVVNDFQLGLEDECPRCNN